jgi:hypothetical protein
MDVCGKSRVIFRLVIDNGARATIGPSSLTPYGSTTRSRLTIARTGKPGESSGSAAYSGYAEQSAVLIERSAILVAFGCDL